MRSLPDRTRGAVTARTAFLADDLTAAARQSIGAPEHEQIANLLSQATRYSLDADTSDALHVTTRQHPFSMETNLDFLRPAHPIVWIEWPGDPTPKAENVETHLNDGPSPERVGCLVAEMPNDPDRLASISAWRFPDGSIHHSYATMIWSLPHMALLASAARTYLGNGVEESTARMIAQAHAFVPSGLKGELEIICDSDQDLDSAMAAARRDVTSEHLRLAAALLLLKTPQVTISDLTIPMGSEEDHPGIRLVRLQESPKSRRRRLADLVPWHRRQAGFCRHAGKYDTWISWEDPRR